MTITENATRPTDTSVSASPGPTDETLRALIRQAAPVSTPPTPTTPAPVPPRKATRSVLPSFFLRKIPGGRASKRRLWIAANAFMLHWFVSTVVSLIYQHFSPGQGEIGQFICLLLGSLATFTCAVVAFIELSKFTWAGSAVAVGLGYVNAIIHGVLAIFAHHWLLALGHFIFAVGLARWLSCGVEPDTPPPHEASNVAPLGRQGAVLMVAAWMVLVLPASFYGYLRATAPADLQALEQRLRREPADAVMQRADDLAISFGWLSVLADLIGEKNARKTEWQANWGFCLAFAGDWRRGYQKIVDATRGTASPQVVRQKAQVYALSHGLRYWERKERDFTEEEADALEDKSSRPAETFTERYYLQTGQLPPTGEYAPEGYQGLETGDPPKTPLPWRRLGE